MKSQGKLIAGMILGAAAATATTLYLKSEKGQKFLSKAEAVGKDLKDSSLEIINEEIDKFKSRSSELKTQAAQVIDQITSQVEDVKAKAKAQLN